MAKFCTKARDGKALSREKTCFTLPLSATPNKPLSSIK
jgi:hypothetical protein